MAKFSKDNQPKGARPFSSTYQPSGRRGRKPGIKTLAPDSREKVYAALWHALTLPDKDAARDYLERASADLPEFGFLIQVYAKGLLGKNGTIVAEQVLDRLFGKARQVADVNLGAQPGTGLQITVADQDTADALTRVLSNHGKPRDPSPDE